MGPIIARARSDLQKNMAEIDVETAVFVAEAVIDHDDGRLIPVSRRRRLRAVPIPSGDVRGMLLNTRPISRKGTTPNAKR